MSWAPAWISESQQERLYFQAPDGGLIARKEIAPTSEVGRFDIAFERGTGDYRLEIPGYSFRYYGLDAPDRLPVVFEPVKLHFSRSVLSNQPVYFKIPAGKPFTLCGKYHQGVGALHIEPVGGGERISLGLKDYPFYSRFDQKVVPARRHDQVWRLRFEGRGKVGFWLDHVPNLFALDPAMLFVPNFLPGVVDATVSKDIIGKTPRIGASLDFAVPSREQLDLIRAAHLDVSSLYFLEDVLTRNMNHDVDIVRTYEEELGIKDYVSLLSWTERDSISTDIYQSLAFTTRYLSHHRGEHELNIPYIALVDEPNLRYASLSDFERDFSIMAEGLRQADNPAVSSTRIAAPETSRMINGPTMDGAEDRIGLDWTRQLLKRHWASFDAISWHEWLVRDLVATDWYADSIERVWDVMVAEAPADAALKDLMITQTNMSSGLDLSPYEQDTFYAALWWTSVIAQSINTGKLAMLNWFKAIDYPPYSKGFISGNDDQGYALKPAGHAMSFVHPAVLDDVLRVEESSVEVDVAATMLNNGEKLNLLGVNKARRSQQINITLEKPESWHEGSPGLRGTVMGADLAQKPLAVNSVTSNDELHLSFELEPETIWTIELNR